jgi:hypothetical protein
LSTARHDGLATSTLIQLAVEHEVTVTPMDNGLKELPDESDFEAGHCLLCTWLLLPEKSKAL